MINLLWLLPLGFISGLLINYIADVLPRERRIGPIPFCLNCKQTFDLTHYITNKSCTACGNKRSLRQVLLPFISAGIISLLFYFPPELAGFWISSIIYMLFAVIFIIDLEYRLILHPVSISGAVIGVLVGIYLNGIFTTLIGGIAGFAIMFALYLFGILFSRWVSKHRGEELSEVALGYGDVNLSGVVGLLLGWPRIWVVMLLAIFLGGVFSAVLLLIMAIRRKYSAFTPIPYAPFIIIAASLIFYLASP